MPKLHCLEGGLPQGCQGVPSLSTFPLETLECFSQHLGGAKVGSSKIPSFPTPNHLLKLPVMQPSLLGIHATTSSSGVKTHDLKKGTPARRPSRTSVASATELGKQQKYLSAADPQPQNGVAK